MQQKYLEQTVRKLKLRNYSFKTIKAYLGCLKEYFDFKKFNLEKIYEEISREEIKNIIDAIRNPKHKLIISLAYGDGLRISEVVNLKVKNVNLEELTIHLKNAKGKKDRITIFPEKIKTELQNLIAGKNLNDYLFESERGGKFNMVEARGVEPLSPADLPVATTCLSGN